MSGCEEGITNEELYAAARETWGDDLQIGLLGEECAELAAEVSRYQRGRIDKEALAEEVADVEVMVEQMRLILDDHLVQDAKIEKLERLLARLREADADV